MANGSLLPNIHACLLTDQQTDFVGTNAVPGLITKPNQTKPNQTDFQVPWWICIAIWCSGKWSIQAEVNGERLPEHWKLPSSVLLARAFKGGLTCWACTLLHAPLYPLTFSFPLLLFSLLLLLPYCYLPILWCACQSYSDNSATMRQPWG